MPLPPLKPNIPEAELLTGMTIRGDMNLSRAAEALHRAFPEMKKLNYGAYGDTGCHLHMHLVPKYEGGFEYGGVFAMNPGQTLLTDEQYAEMIEKIKANL